MKIVCLSLLLLVSELLFSQSRESFDIASYEIPEGWTKDSKEGVRIYSRIDAAKNGYCVIAVYASEKGTGDPKKDFEEKWKSLAVDGYQAEAAPVTEIQATADGWQAVAAASKGKTDGADCFIVLTVFSGFGKRTTVIANLNHQSFVTPLDQVLGSIRLDNSKAVGTLTVQSVIDAKLIGKWAKSSSGPPQYSNGKLINLVNSGFHKAQYDFRSDGSYSFHGESQFSTNDFALTDEKGTFTLAGNTLVLTPSQSSVKKVDLNGKFKSSEQIPLAKRKYSYQFQFFEGIGETQLVLSGVSENILDGGYGSNSSFPASFLYSREYSPEWRFIPQ